MGIVSTIGPDGKRVEAEATVDNADRVVEALETGKKVKTRVTVEKAVKAAKAIEKKTGPVRGPKADPAMAETVKKAEKKTGPVRGPKAEKVVKTGKVNKARAFEIIKGLKTQGVENKLIIKAVMEEFKLEKKDQALAFYYVTKAYPRSNPEG